jgi:hypothetical protein
MGRLVVFVVKVAVDARANPNEAPSAFCQVRNRRVLGEKGLGKLCAFSLNQFSSEGDWPERMCESVSYAPDGMQLEYFVMFVKA